MRWKLKMRIDPPGRRSGRDRNLTGRSSRPYHGGVLAALPHPARTPVLSTARTLMGLSATMLLVACTGSSADDAATTTTTTTTSSTTTTTAPPTTTTTAKPIPPGLGRGAKGPDVQTLEERLAALKYDTGIVNDTFDAMTQHAVIAFQKVHG